MNNTSNIRNPDHVYTVVVVEDEIIAMQHICRIIEQKCPSFKVIAKAEDGESGLASARSYLPDVMITDIHMPLMNGVDLLKIIGKELPETLTIAVSGYQDFQYVKGALTSGSLDYLLKPITPNKIQSVLEKAEEQLIHRYSQKQINLLEKLTVGIQISRQDENKYFPEKYYYTAMIRENSLPCRFNRTHDLGVDKKSERPERMLIFHGRDAGEKLYLCSNKYAYSLIKFTQMIKDIMVEERSVKDDYIFLTAVISCKPFSITQISKVFEQLLCFLDSRLIIGKDQLLFYEDGKKTEGLPKPLGEHVLHRIDFFLQENKFSDLKYEIQHLIRSWEKDGVPQLWVEESVHQIINHLFKHANNDTRGSRYDFLLDDVFYQINSYEDLQEKVIKIIQHIIKEEYGTFQKVDTPEFFSSVDDFIKTHFTESITLPALCRKFGISQTYMSKLFRKYSGNSFNGYVKKVRLMKAQQLMHEDRNLKIKDIAEIVGFRDQFYFSRLFRREVGMTPSEYAEFVKNSGVQQFQS